MSHRKLVPPPNEQRDCFEDQMMEIREIGTGNSLMHRSDTRHGWLKMRGRCILNRRSAVVVLVVLTIAEGCGPRFDTAPVSGTVTLNGKTIAGIAVMFEPQSGGAPVSTGVTDSSGRYSLKTVGNERQEGALIGKHQIRFRYADPDVKSDMSYEQAAAVMSKNETLMPPSARDGSMTFDVPRSGTADANFDLRSPRS